MSLSSQAASRISKLSPQQATVYASMSKSTTIAVLLALFLGGLGAQWFYLNKNLTGVLSVLFCWTLIPALTALIFIFLASEAVEKCNLKLLNKFEVQ